MSTALTTGGLHERIDVLRDRANGYAESGLLTRAEVRAIWDELEAMREAVITTEMLRDSGRATGAAVGLRQLDGDLAALEAELSARMVRGGTRRQRNVLLWGALGVSVAVGIGLAIRFYGRR